MLVMEFAACMFIYFFLNHFRHFKHSKQKNFNSYAGIDKF